MSTIDMGYITTVLGGLVTKGYEAFHNPLGYISLYKAGYIADIYYSIKPTVSDCEAYFEEYKVPLYEYRARNRGEPLPPPLIDPLPFDELPSPINWEVTPTMDSLERQLNKILSPTPVPSNAWNDDGGE